MFTREAAVGIFTPRVVLSATPTHTEFITKSSKAGKAVFCDKPIDLDKNKVNELSLIHI